MLKTSTWLIVLWLGLMAFARPYFTRYCCADNVSAVSTAGSNAAFSIADGSSFSASSPDDLLFNVSQFNLLPPSQSLKAALVQTRDYLQKNPQRALQLTGIYGDDEKNTGIYSDLGLARANQVKSLLSELGIPTAQMFAASIKNPTLQRTGDTVLSAIQFAFADLPKDDDRLQAIYQSLSGKPIVLHFETNQSQIELTEEQRKNFSDLTYYLDHKKGSKIEATGFTDNQGSAAKNLELGQQRADFVRGYLAKQGVNAQQISASSQGIRQPVAPNNNAEGRAQNRRVEISLN